VNPSIVALLVTAAAGVGIHQVATHNGIMTQRARDERRSGLLVARRRLRDAVLKEDAGWVAGRAGGFHMTYRLKSAGFGRQTWTEIDVAVPESPAALELELRAHASGVSAKLVTGNPFYDAFYLRVDPPLAGPELFDISIRKRLLDLRPIRLRQGSSGLQVRVEGWSQSGLRVKELLAVSAALGSRIVDAGERLARMGRRSAKKFRRWYR
jgi:hypothetical protein